MHFDRVTHKVVCSLFQFHSYSSASIAQLIIHTLSTHTRMLSTQNLAIRNRRVDEVPPDAGDFARIINGSLFSLKSNSPQGGFRHALKSGRRVSQDRRVEHWTLPSTRVSLIKLRRSPQVRSVIYHRLIKLNTPQRGFDSNRLLARSRDCSCYRAKRLSAVRD